MLYYPKKLELENRIFARAQRLDVPVEGLCGELMCDSADAQLQVMISVYNAFFAEENYSFMAEELERDAAVYDAWLEEFLLRRPCLPGIIATPGVPFFKQDYAAELFWAQL